MQPNQAEESSQKLVYSNWIKELYFYNASSKNEECGYRAMTFFLTAMHESLFSEYNCEELSRKRRQRKDFSLHDPVPNCGMNDPVPLFLNL